ncbi:MAG: hypothetical protein ACR2MG_21305 [Pyrinomonadaceae bacterium]
MRSIKEQLVLVYCLADDRLKSEKNGGKWRCVQSQSEMHGCRNNGGGNDAKLLRNSDANTHLFTD